MTIEYQHDIDTTGLHCPLPLLRLKKTLTGVESGEIIRLRATDPAAHLDIGVFSEKTGHKILESFCEDDIQYFFIQKK
ncbi:MAG: sulfurtransferase TusA family protein [Gammaproteobacteria bacterium]|nr:sulfurtransferase TusA family protein [Gammaproteobacteria bacterium]